MEELDLKAELEAILGSEYAHMVTVDALNGITEDMQRLDSLVILSCKPTERAAIMRVTWDLKYPKEPVSFDIEYLANNTGKTSSLKLKAFAEFKEHLATGAYCKKNVALNFMKHVTNTPDNGHVNHASVHETITATLGRHAASLISFLDGNDDYKSLDVTYDDQWGAW
jgi:hypothetical protein